MSMGIARVHIQSKSSGGSLPPAAKTRRRPAVAGASTSAAVECTWVQYS